MNATNYKWPQYNIQQPIRIRATGQVRPIVDFVDRDAGNARYAVLINGRVTWFWVDELEAA